MRNLQRQFPDGNFETYDLTSRRVPAFPYFHFDFRRDAYDVHVIRCLDYDITFTTLNGRDNTYLARLFSHHMTTWNNQFTDALSNTISNIYANSSNPRSTIHFLTDGLGERSVRGSHLDIRSIEGSHIWLRDIASFEEGFTSISHYEGVGGVFFDISYSLYLNTMDIDAELESIKKLIQEFVLPFHSLVSVEDRRTVMRLRVNFIKLDSNNAEQDILLGRFEWIHDSIADEKLENLASFHLLNYFEIATIHDYFTLFNNDDVCFEGHNLVGTWGNRNQIFRRYHFNADGTGRSHAASTGEPERLWQIANDEGQDFIWRISDDDYLHITFGGDVVWTQVPHHSRINDIYIVRSTCRIMPLAIDGNVIELEVPRRRGGNYVFDKVSYTRVEWPQYLYGSWSWEMDSTWVTTMNADGTGRRGLPDDILEFRWIIDAETRQLWIVRPDSRRESWSYELDGDVLILTNWFREDGQQQSQLFRYTRVR